MHETSLVRSLLAQVEQLLDEHGGDAVARVVVEAGPLSGVEPQLVREAFDLLGPATRAAGATLQIEEVPLQAECSRCRVEFEVPSFRFVCTACGSQSVRVIRGDAFRLLSIDVTTPVRETSRR